MTSLKKWHWLGAMMILAPWLGCDFPDRPDIAAFRNDAQWSSINESTRSGAIQAGLAKMVADQNIQEQPFPTEWETHELRFRGETVVGRTHLKSTRDSDDSIRVQIDRRTKRRIGQAEMLETVKQELIHDSNGVLQRIESRWRNGPIEREQTAAVNGRRLEFEESMRPRNRKSSVAVPDRLVGPLHIYHSLLRQPMDTGQRRTANAVVPALGKIAKVQMECTGPSGAAGLIPTQEPLRELIVQSQIGDNQTRTMFHWFDSLGRIHKSNVSGQDESTYRCTPQQYTTLGESIANETRPLTLDIPGKPFPPGKLKQVGYSIHIPAGVIALPSSADNGENEADRTTAIKDWMATLTGPRQYAQSIDEQNFKIIVSDQDVSERKLAKKFSVFRDTPNELDVRRTSLIDSNSKTVRRLSSLSTTSNDLDARSMALALTQTVHSFLTYQPMTEGLRSAAEVADSSVADSTEQAVLLMAMLRSRSIPCRMALGVRREVSENAESPDSPLRFRQPTAELSNSMTYHAWVMAFADETWLSLDPVAGGETDADYLMLDQTSLADTDPRRMLDRYLQRLATTRFEIFAAVPK
ncbi:MAG: transglutaminase-like domain-containing protein [Planctomycetota bacterium]